MPMNPLTTIFPLFPIGIILLLSLGACQSTTGDMPTTSSEGDTEELTSSTELIEIVSKSPTDGLTDDKGYSIVTSGLPYVPVGTYVYLTANGDNITNYQWNLNPPTGSTAFLDSTTSKEVRFKTDIIGRYEVTLDNDYQIIYARNWAGKDMCSMCHEGEIKEDIITPWSKTKHATGLESLIVKPYFKEDCLACHTLGYNQSLSAVNNGFDDIADSIGWTFSNDWSSIPSELKDMANVQCENCHGIN
jgi:hypothetical protein